MIQPGTVPCIRTFASAFGCTGCSGRHPIGGSPMIMLEIILQRYAIGLIEHYGLNAYVVPDSRLVSVRGYPDLTIWGGRRVLWRELKRQNYSVSREQRQVMHGLLVSGGDVGMWRPGDLYTGAIETQIAEVSRV